MLVGQTTSDDITITGKSNHFIARIIGSIEERRSGVSVEDALKALQHADEVIESTKSRKYRLHNICEVTVNPSTGNLIQTNPHKKGSKK